jgi:predicted GH43/DUF377 family glycosyl hydrolase
MKKTLTLSTCLLLAATLLPGFNSNDAGITEDTSWALTGIERPAGKNPIISPDTSSSFFCPMREKTVKWEFSDTFNPAAAVYKGQVVVLYRAEDNSAQGIGSRTSRLGYASSADGVNFNRSKYPVFYPAKDGEADQEIPGGCEDPRIACTVDGTYVMLYTQWNHKVPRLGVATSRDLKTWTKHESAFRKAYGGKYFDMATKSASVLTRIDHGKQVIAKIGGKYFMYWGEEHVYAATSENLTDWTPLQDEKGSLKVLFSPRKGRFDSQLTECGPPAILTQKGILLLYNGKNKAGVEGDPTLPANAYCAGQALFDREDPTRLIKRLDKPFMQPTDSFEKSGQYPAGTVFIEGLVYFRNKWFLYYGCADSRVAVAVSSDKI